MAAYRHLKRITVIQALFEWEFYSAEVDAKKAQESLEYAYQETMSYAVGKEKEIAGQEFKPKQYKPDEWTASLLDGTIKNIDKIRELVVQYAPEWPLDKIAPVDRVILYLAIYELVFSDETPEIVVINEAVEIAKAYGGQNSSKFINGVLNSIYQKEKRTSQAEK